MTTYVVLRERVDHAGAPYVVLTRLEAHNAPAACRAAAADLDDQLLDEGVTLVAVPARNWQHVELRAETSRRVVRS